MNGLGWMAALLPALVAGVLGAQQPGFVRGRITDDDHRAVAAAEISLRTVVDAIRATRSDSAGKFALATRDLRGAFVLSIRAVGFVPLDSAIQITDDVSTFALGDIRLKRRIDLLDPVSSRAVPKLVPARGDDQQAGASSRSTNYLREMRSDPSSLNDLLAQLPGVVRTENGVSVLGAAPEQTKIRVDGLEFQGGRVPRDAIDDARLVTSSFDPSVGRFAGGEFQVKTRRSSEARRSVLRAQVSPSGFAISEASKARQAPSSLSLSGFVTGRLFLRGLTGLAAIDATRRSIDLPNFASMTGRSLEALGLSEISREQILSAATSAGVPQRAFEANRKTDVVSGSAIARLDFNSRSSATSSVVWLSTYSDASQGLSGPLALPATTPSPTTRSNRLSISHSGYVGPLLDELRFSVSALTIASRVASSVPTAQLQVPTTSKEGAEGALWIGLGGSGSEDSEVTMQQASLVHESRYVVGTGIHQMKVTQELNWQRRRDVNGGGVVGTYSFSSVERLARNAPSSFTRVTSNPQSTADQLSGNLSLGDVWNLRPGRIQLTGGLRADWSQVMSTPEKNLELDAVLGHVNEKLPVELYLSPRLGVSWRLTGAPFTPLAPPGTTTPMSTTARAVRTPADAAGVQIPVDDDGLMLSGGIGAYRGTLPIPLISELLEQRGLSNSVRRLNCVGDQPAAKWLEGATAAPSACQGVSSSDSILAASTTQLLARDFQSPVSWRISAQLSGMSAFGWGLVPELTLVSGRYSESISDRNIRTAPAFTLSAERNRFVYAEPKSIDGQSGAIDVASSRLLPTYGQVLYRRSDLSYHLTNLLVGLAPQKPIWGGGHPFAVWSWTQYRFQSGGIGNPLASELRKREWVSGGVPQYDIQLGFANLGVSWIRVSGRLRLLSDRTFTPVVAQDVNGDGQANDPAFVFDPASVSDPSLAQEMSALLNRLNPQMRKCLRSQLGQIARQNSCKAGWSGNLDLALRVVPTTRAALGKRLLVSATVSNASTLLVRLFRLQNTLLGREAVAAPDRRLLFVQGFNSMTRNFEYRVNQQFGTPSGAGAYLERPPFEVHLGIALLFDKTKQ